MGNLRKPITLFVISLIILVLVGVGMVQATTTSEISLANADAIYEGEELGDWAAYSISPAGDVNGDGYDDILIGAPLAGNKVTEEIPKGEGKAYLVLGRPRAEWPADPTDLALADASFIGCRPTSMTARQNYTAGDVNGDGYDDFLISGWKCGSGLQGKAYLFLGKPNIDWGVDFPVEGADASFLGENLQDKASYYVSTAGDVDGDGYDDFLIASPHNSEVAYKAGQVYLILGRPAADWGTDFSLSEADASFLAEAEDDRAGRSVAGVGDVNGDGNDDFLIGAIFSDEGGTNAGESYLVLGRATADWGMDYPLSIADASFVGETSGDESGRRVAGAGDVNGDGYQDLIIGASRNEEAGSEAGKTYLILGRPEADWGVSYSLALADASFLGADSGEQSGRRVSSAGDFDGDGYDDFLIGAPHSDLGGVGSGAAYLILGRSAADWGPAFPLDQADAVYIGETGIGRAGYDVARAGDVDGDGIDDFLVGAYGGRALLQPGRAYVLLGGVGPVPLSFSPDAPDGEVGEWHGFAGVYWDRDSWEDIATAQLALGRNPEDRAGLNVKYEAAENALYLRDRDFGMSWLGPCSPGEGVILSNGVVQLDCSGSTITNDGDQILDVTWRGRWLRPTTRPRVMTAHLRAIDQAGNDSGYVELGTWTLLP